MPEPQIVGAIARTGVGQESALLHYSVGDRTLDTRCSSLMLGEP